LGLPAAGRILIAETASKPLVPEEPDLPHETAAPKARKSRRSKSKPSCETCYFGVRMLCALELGEPCSTFRPDSPHGLIPPKQPMLLINADDVSISPELVAA